MKFIKLSWAAIITGLILTPWTTEVRADAHTLLEKATAGETVRIGFANEVPWAYPGEDNEPLGFVNAIATGILTEMGITNIEPVVTDWGGLIPGLNANRFDIITGGMYILTSRCENVTFSEPIGVFGDAFIVAAGNPKGIQTYDDIRDMGAVLVTGAGYNIVEVAKRLGIEDSNIMQVPGPTEILAAVRAGRADAGGVTFFTARSLAAESEGEIDITDPSLLPEWTFNWVGIAFRHEDTDFVAAFNDALASWIGSDAMMAAVAEYDYTASQLPGEGSTEYACANR
ncbi:MAG: transporter substrate-binding domain-containing protein [Alphaproteobacteria bacterium]|nr:transporter substrate-binding domain-containing protein [Alphaproteobacteria bacterium]